MSRLLFVVHRYAPFPGGSEIYVRNMAEEALARGHDVTVLAATHDPEALIAGHYNRVKITNDHNVILTKTWDLIIVHGGDVSSQDAVHIYSSHIKSPVLYLIVKPSDSQNCMQGIMAHRFLGYSTQIDVAHIEKYGQLAKARRIRHGIRLTESLGDTIRPSGAKSMVFVSAGGFWPHKGFSELAEAFNEVFEGTDHQLWLYGYDCASHAPPYSKNVTPFFGAARQTVINSIGYADAYIMNSTEEGFGLVLLESLANMTPWIARDIAGASMLKDFGTTYNTKAELKSILKNWAAIASVKKEQALRGHKYVLKNHLISNTVDDIEAVLEEIG